MIVMGSSQRGMMTQAIEEQAGSAKGWLIVGVSLALLLGITILKARVR
jgi:hypothetical protein